MTDPIHQARAEMPTLTAHAATALVRLAENQRAEIAALRARPAETEIAKLRREVKRLNARIKKGVGQPTPPAVRDTLRAAEKVGGHHG